MFTLLTNIFNLFIFFLKFPSLVKVTTSLHHQGKRTLFLQCLRHKGFSYYLVLLLKIETLAT